MKNNPCIQAAVAAALLAAAGTAAAVTPADDHFLRVGGSTATNGLLFDLYVNAAVGMCGSGVDVYTSTTVTDINADSTIDASDVDVSAIKKGAQVMVTCQSKVLASPYTAMSNSPIGYNKESNGGSGNGVGKLANHGNASGTLAFFNATAPSCSTSTISVPAAGSLSGFTLHYTCTGTNTTQTPELGIADVEGRLLGYTGSDLQAKPLLDIVFGAPVSIPLYRKLQQLQSLTQDDGCDHVPSLTKGQIASIYATGPQVPSSIVYAGMPDQVIHICRRGNSSGTQAGAKAFFMAEGCAANIVPFATPDVASSVGSGIAWAATHLGEGVFAGSGGGEVQKCLSAYSGNTGDDYAIGVLSTENAPLTSATDNQFRFVKVDGAMPTLQGTANGAYQYFTSNVMNISNTIAYQPAEVAMYTFISSIAGNPALVGPLNQPTRNGVCVASGTTFGDGGVLSSSKYIDVLGGLPAGYTAPFTGQMVRDNALNTQTKQPTGSINNCQTPLTHLAIEVEVPGGK